MKDGFLDSFRIQPWDAIISSSIEKLDRTVCGGQSRTENIEIRGDVGVSSYSFPVG